MGHLATIVMGLGHLVTGTMSLCCCPQSRPGPGRQAGPSMLESELALSTLCPAPSLCGCGYKHVSASWRAGPSHTVFGPPSPPYLGPGFWTCPTNARTQALVQPL